MEYWSDEVKPKPGPPAGAELFWGGARGSGSESQDLYC